VTYSRTTVEERDGEWCAYVVFDVRERSTALSPVIPFERLAPRVLSSSTLL